LVDVLIASAQSAVHMICESITCRISGVSEKTKKQAINPDLLVPAFKTSTFRFDIIFPGLMLFFSNFWSNI
jgi:hypothetical protein